MGLLVAFVFATYIAACAYLGDGWVPLVDDANFAVHEAGHPLAGLVAVRLGVYGGTFAQLLLPAICAFTFARRGARLSCALCIIWLGESLLNVARYVADARAMRLPIVSFSEHALHDWNLILLRWNALHYDTTIADGVRAVAWLLIAAALAWVVTLRLRSLEKSRSMEFIMQKKKEER